MHIDHVDGDQAGANGTTNMNFKTAAQFIKFTLARQCGENWRDRTIRGSGNRAARRAIRTQAGRDHLRFAGEDIYTERPEILQRGAELLARDMA